MSLSHSHVQAGIVSLHFTNVETEASGSLETCLRSHSSPMGICLALKR